MTRRARLHSEQVGHLDDGDLDEVVAEYPPLVHLESLSDRNAYINFHRPDGSVRAVELFVEEGKLRMTSQVIPT